MATCLEIITDALVWRGVLAEGRAPDAKMTKSAMSVLRSVYLELVNTGALGELQPVTIDADYAAQPGQRIISTAPDNVNVSLPDTIADGYGNNLAPRQWAVIVIVASGSPLTYIYSSPNALWQAVETLEPEDAAPISATLEEGLKAAVCLRLRYPGVPLDPMAVRAEQRFYTALTHHYTEPRRYPEPYRPFCDYRDQDWI